MAGDFRQVLPIIKRASSAQIINACINKSDLWDCVQIFRLRINMRVLKAISKNPHDPHAHALQEFADFLERVGDGKEPAVPTLGEGVIVLPKEMISRSKNHAEFINEIYPNIRNSKDEKYYSDKAILAPKNVDINMLNDVALNMLSDDPAHVFYSADHLADEDNSDMYQQEDINNVEDSSLPPHKLILKRGAPIMLLRTINARIGACNGTRMIVKDFTPRLIDAIIVSGKFAGQRLFLPRCSLTLDDPQYPFTLTRRQFPVRLAFAMTINKAQGQTLGNVGCFLPRPVFAHGQLYVALSRATSVDTVSVYLLGDKVRGHGHQTGTNSHVTHNIVYRQVLA